MPKMFYNDEQQKQFLAQISDYYNNREIISNQEIRDYVSKHSLAFPHFLFRDINRRAGRGNYNVAITLPSNVKPIASAKPQQQTAPVANVQPATSMRVDISCVVPERDPTYVPFGNYLDIEKIIQSRVFFPVYITGLSGNGKTMSITQACAKLNRQMLRINVTEETDELDLLGGTELVNGNTIFREGAVLLAMREGAVLLIDEGDLNNTKILCLMPILEGKPYLNKKTGEVISPAPGFNIFITGNTKGKGSDDGRFVGTKVMNEAFLERFSVTFEQEYPAAALEKKILLKNMQQLNCVDNDFATKLCTWAELIRKLYGEGGIDELISTRRLVHIVKTFAIFNDRKKAVELCLNRFDNRHKKAFSEFYEMVDDTVASKTDAADHTGTVETATPEGPNF